MKNAFNAFDADSLQVFGGMAAKPITQKTGEILKINLKTKEVINLDHALKVVQPHWQAGMLDVLYSNEEIFVSYTEDMGNDKTSTSIARGFIEDNELVSLQNIFQSQPPLWDNIHWGSRIMLSLIHI